MSIKLKTDNLIYPYFVVSGRKKREVIPGFPGVARFSVDMLLKDIAAIRKLGLNKILLFGIPDVKDAMGEGAYAKDSLVIQAIKAIKTSFPGISVITDICLCAYTSHGHCGIIKAHPPAYRSAGCAASAARSPVKIDNKLTLEALAKMALMHVQAGADWVAPSAMAKRQVSAICSALKKNGFQDRKILGYSAKFASHFYGPFRSAAHSAPRFGDRSSYQLDYSDGKKALREIKDDLREGADMVMVKPALSYLDVIRQAKDIARVPLVAYNVSGEYVLVKNGAIQGLWKEREMVFEILTSIKRAGADLIISYHAKDVARWLSEVKK